MLAQLACLVCTDREKRYLRCFSDSFPRFVHDCLVFIRRFLFPALEMAGEVITLPKKALFLRLFVDVRDFDR